MKITKIKLTVMTHELHCQYHQDIMDFINKKPATVLETIGLPQWTPPYFAALEREKLALDIILKSKFTAEMAESDNGRDNTYRGFVSAVKSLLYHFDPEIRGAAKRVTDVFNHYGDVPKRSYNEESAAIDDIMREFEKPDLAADLVTLNAVSWRDRLKFDNDGFKSLSHLRVEEAAGRTPIRMKDARVETDEHYRNIVLHLEYMVRAGKTSQELTGFITELNSYATSYKNIMARRQGSSKSQQPAAEE
jgi:hypothetical protein